MTECQQIISTTQARQEGGGKEGILVDIGGLVLSFDSVLSKLAKIKINKSSEPDFIYSRVLYELRYQLLRPSFQIFQQFFKSKVLPLDWKEANVVSIFKKGKSVN